MKTAKRATTKAKKASADDDLQPEYDFGAMKTRRNPYARLPREQMVVLLDKDVAKVFKSPEQVNHALRLLIEALPSKG